LLCVLLHHRQCHNKWLRYLILWTSPYGSLWRSWHWRWWRKRIVGGDGECWLSSNGNWLSVVGWVVDCHIIWWTVHVTKFMLLY
jgi:hypothetical protein